MSIQIKKKFIKSQVIDGTKVLFLNEDSFKALNSQGEATELFKLSSGDKLVMLQMPQVSSDPVADEDLSRKKYVDDSLEVEMLAREAGDEALSEDLATETAARIAAVSAEQAARDAAILVETNARIASDNLLLPLDGSRGMVGDLSMAGVSSPVEASVFNGDTLTLFIDSDYYQFGDMAKSLLIVPIGTTLTGTENTFYAPSMGNSFVFNWTQLVEGMYDFYAVDSGFGFNPNAAIKLGVFRSEPLQFFPHSELGVNNKIVNVADGVDANDAVNKSQLDAEIARATAAEVAEAAARAAEDLTFLKLDGSRSMEGNLNMEKLSSESGGGIVSSYNVYQPPGQEGTSAWRINFVLNDPTNIFQYGGDFWEGSDDGSLSGFQNNPPNGPLSAGIGYITGPFGVRIFWAVPKQPGGMVSNFAAAVKIGTLDYSKTDSTAFTPEGGVGVTVKYKIVGLADGVSENDAVNKSQLDAAVSGINSDISDAETSLAAETAAREAADIALDERLDVLEGADTVEGSVAKAEKDAKDHADSIVAIEEAARIAGDAALQSDIDAEEARALAAEGVLQSNIDSEETRAMAAETTLQSNIDAEETRAMAAEGVLQSNIDVEKSRIDAILLASDADKDSFAEIVALINSVDIENDNVFASYVLSNDAALAAEVAAREAADSAEATIRAAADVVLTDDLAAEIARATAAEVALDARLDVLETDPTTKTYVDQQISSVTSDITDLDGYAQDIRSDLDEEILDRVADVNAEEARAMAAEAALSASISSEAAARAAADSAEQAARIAGDAAEASAREAAISAEQAAREAEDLTFFKHDGSRQMTGGLNMGGFVISDAAPAVFATDVMNAGQVFQEITDAVALEAAAREAADVALQSAIDAEEVRALAAEASLQSELDAEEAARAAQDLVLDSKIDTKFQESKDYTDQKVADLVASAPAVLDTLKELADALGGDANFATTVASQIANAANDLGDRFMYEQFVVDAGMISAGYMELGYKGFAASMVVSNGRLMMFEGEDYSVSVVGGKSRLTFMGSILPSEAEALEIGDIIKVKYLKDVR